MEFGGRNGFLVEPGPAAFYLPAEESQTGVEEELFKFDIPSSMLNDCCDLPFNENNEFHHPNNNLFNEEPMEVQLSLDDFIAEGIDLHQLISVKYDKNGMPIYSSFVDCSEEDDFDETDMEYSKKSHFNNTSRPGSLLKTSDGTSKFKKKYVCSKCKGKVMVGLEKVLRHMLKNHCATTGSNKTRTYLCSLCDSVLSTESSLKKHIRNVHFRMEAFECPVCKKQIQQRSHLRRHIEKIHGGRKALKRVLKRVGDIVKQNKSFFNDLSITKNDPKNQSILINQFGENDIGGLFDETQQCPTCGILCTSKAHLALHLIDSHHMGKNQVLNILKESRCETNITEHGGSELSNEHQRNINSSNSFTSSLVCPICASACIDLSSLNAHIYEAHRYLTQYRCQNCTSNNDSSTKQQFFFSQAVLDAHIEDKHNKQRESRIDEYKCEHCKNAKFAIFHSTSSSEMLDHVLTSHAYGCAQCPKHFSTTGGLKHHYKKAHFTEFNDIDSSKIMKTEKQSNRKQVPHGISPNTQIEVEKESDRNKSSEFSVDTGDESVNTPQHLNAPLTATINSEDKAINPQILSQIRLDVDNIVDRIRSSGGDLKAIPCDFCRSTETHENGASLLHHICTEHPYRCIYCPEKMVKLPTSMRKHFRKYHRDETPYFCRFCTAVFVCQGDANQHSLTAHSSEKNNLYRTTTTAGTTPSKITSPELSKKNLGVDENRQSNTTPITTGKDTGSGICIVCDKDFGDLRHLSDHVQEAHNYICEVCNREYKLADSIRKHCRKDHSDYYEEPIVCCRFCPTIFHNIPAKQEHIATVHGIRMSGGKYLAPVNTSINNESLTSTTISSPTPTETLVDVTMPLANMANTGGHENHESGPIYKCPHCPKGYDITDSLRKHAKNAHNVALGFCRDCQLVFLSHEEKTDHVNNVHGQLDVSTQNLSTPTNSITSPSNDTQKRQTSILKYLSPSSSEDTVLEKDTSSASSTTPVIIGMSKSGYGEVSIDDAYQCPKCPKIYAIGKSLRKHCRKVHDELSICFCSSCTTVFVTHEERDRHVSDGGCKGFKNAVSTAPATEIVIDTTGNEDAAPSMGTRKRRHSSRKEIPQSPSLPKQNVTLGEPITRLQRSGSYINSLSSPALSTLQHPSVQNITVQSNDKSRLMSKSISSSGSASPSSSSTVTVINNIRGKIVSPVLEISSGASKVSTTLTTQLTNNSGSSDVHPNIQATSDAVYVFQCDFCDVPAFSSKDLLKQHWMEYHPFGCTLCPKRYKLASSIRRHMHEAHHKKEVFVCHTCTLPFFSFGDKQSHLPNCKPLLSKNNQSIPNGEKINENVNLPLKGSQGNKYGVFVKQGAVTREKTVMRASPRQKNNGTNQENSLTLNDNELKTSESIKNEISTKNMLAKNIDTGGNDAIPKNKDNAELGEKKGESKISSRSTLEQKDTSSDQRTDTKEPGSTTNTGYTTTLPLSPLNFHGFKKPSNEMETVQGLGDFRDGLNAYAVEYFIGNAVFDAELFESKIVTETIKDKDEEGVCADAEDSKIIVPENLEDNKQEKE